MSVARNPSSLSTSSQSQSQTYHGTAEPSRLHSRAGSSVSINGDTAYPTTNGDTKPKTHEEEEKIPNDDDDDNDDNPNPDARAAMQEEHAAQELRQIEQEVDWADDPRNPRNWSTFKKWQSALVVSLYTLIPPMASSMMSPGLPELAAKYGIKNESLLSLTLSIFILSFGLGPLILAPLSEIYGRSMFLHVGNVLTIAFSLGCAYAPNTGTFLGMRFLAGFSGSTPIAIGPGTMTDLFAEKDRALATAMYSLGPLLGPSIGPIAGGFIAQKLDIKWVFIVIACCAAVGSAIGIWVLRETYAPVVQFGIAKSEGNKERMRRLEEVRRGGAKSTAEFLWGNISRPVLYLTRSLICFLLGLYMAVLYGSLFPFSLSRETKEYFHDLTCFPPGIYYLMFTTFPQLFSKVYGFKPGVSGLAYLGLGTGLLLSTILGAHISTTIFVRLCARNGGVYKPEYRIPGMAPGAITVPIGLFWYAWSAQERAHWILPIIGTGIFGFGFMSTFLPLQLYMMDSFQFAASVSAAAALFRSLFGFVFPLFATQMFDAMGIGGGNSFLAGIAIILGIPFPLFLYFNGEKLRARNPYTRDSVKGLHLETREDVDVGSIAEKRV